MVPLLLPHFATCENHIQKKWWHFWEINSTGDEWSNSGWFPAMSITVTFCNNDVNIFPWFPYEDHKSLKFESTAWELKKSKYPLLKCYFEQRKRCLRWKLINIKQPVHFITISFHQYFISSVFHFIICVPFSPFCIFWFFPWFSIFFWVLAFSSFLIFLYAKFIKSQLWFSEKVPGLVFSISFYNNNQLWRIKNWD